MHARGITMTSHERHIQSKHRSFDWLFNRLCGPTSRKHRSLHYWPFVRGIHQWPGEFPAQRASNAEKADIWWRHHGRHSTTRQRLPYKYGDVMTWMRFVKSINRSPVAGFPSRASYGDPWYFLNKRLSKQSWRLWYETPSRSLWRLSNRLPVHSAKAF